MNNISIRVRKIADKNMRISKRRVKMMLGENFRELRTARGMALKDVAKGVASVATVSKFENGVTDLAAGKVTALLKNMGVSFREFASLSDQSTGHAGSFLFKAVAAYRNDDQPQMREIVLEQMDQYHKTRSEIDFNDMMSAAGLYCDISGEILVSDKDLAQLMEKLRTISEWNENEIILFGNAMTLLPDNHIFMFARDLLAHLDQIKSWNMSLYRDGWSAVLNAVDTLMQHEVSYCPVLLRLCNAEEVPITISIILFRRRFLTLCYNELTEPSAANRQKIIDLLAILQFNGSTKLWGRYRRSTLNLVGNIFEDDEAK